VLTIAGVMKTTKKNYQLSVDSDQKKSKLLTVHSKLKREPGRFVGAKYIPNRIFRGRIVDALREHPKGLTVDQIGKEITMDYSEEHLDWLKKLITKLVQEEMIVKKSDRYVL